MADHTHIEWTDATWNIITGCSVVSGGCKHCYAMKLAGTRLQHHPSRAGLTQMSAAGPVWNGEVRFNEQWLDQPMRWTKPRLIFVCAHGDLFHEAVPDEWLDRVFAVMALCPQHTFQVLTKRPARMLAYLAQAEMEIRDAIKYDESAQNMRWPLPNVWLGVSVEDQAAADERIPLLLRTPATVRWVSAEPLLGPVRLDDIEFERGNFINALDLEEWRGLEHSPEVQASPGRGALIDWVVAGGESGHNARPMHPDWVRSLRDQCAVAGVAFLFKQWGEWLPYLGLPVPGQYTSGGLFLRPNGRLGNQGEWWEGKAQAVDKVGKKAAGRLLDGKQHDGYPDATS